MNWALGFHVALLTATACGGQEGSLPTAGELVLRNVFRGSTGFHIAEAVAFQYGTIHVDGPEGGMMYRFETDARSIEWLIARWSLQPAPRDSAPSLPPVEDPPGWWRPAARTSMTPLSADSTDVTGGVRTVLLFRDPVESVVYWREHYQASPRGRRP